MTQEIEAILSVGSTEQGFGQGNPAAGGMPGLKPSDTRKAVTQRAASPESSLATAPAIQAPEDVGLIFVVGKSSDDLVIQVVDRKTHQIIREIPPDEMRRMRAAMEAMVGLLLDRSG